MHRSHELYSACLCGIAVLVTAINNVADGVTFARGGGLNIYGPTINIIRDPRWGRNSETVSEDPYWTGVYSATFIRGLQEGEDPRYVKIAGCCKHFLAYSLEDSDVRVL